MDDTMESRHHVVNRRQGMEDERRTRSRLPLKAILPRCSS